MVNTMDLPAHAGFYPAKSLEGKRNFKSTFRIDTDGSVTSIVRLRVLDDRIREQIICMHFLSSYVRWILRDEVYVTFQSRDNPWDFRIELSNDIEFNLEVTSIAEDKETFTQRSRENRLGRVIGRKTIPLSLLRKLHKDFPTVAAEEIIEKAVRLGARRNDEVSNPWHGEMEPVYVGGMPRTGRPLIGHIADSINQKAAKQHDDKKDTILVIDNQSTTFELEDLHEAGLQFETLRESCPFKEVWFYTGYYSDDDGSNAEWSFAPVLLPPDTTKLYRAGIEQGGTEPNGAGLVFGGF